MSAIDWNEQFKIRMTQALKSRDKHEVVKLMLVRKLIRKYKSQKMYLTIYTEFEVEQGIICDVYFENYKDKSKIAYEIQEDMSKYQVENKVNKYKKWEDPFCTTDMILIPLKEFSDNINEIESKLEEYIVWNGGLFCW